MIRFALGIEYQGQYFSGWQSQPSHNTVQDTLNLALSEMANEPIKVVAAGRTDQGVHALEQIVHFDTTAVRPLTAWVRGVNAKLPKFIAVLWACEVSNLFNARTKATGRTYRYWLLNQSIRPSVLQGLCGWYHYPLNKDAICQALPWVIGRHDFTSFRAAECQAKSPVRHMTAVSVVKQNDFWCFTFKSESFLYHMIRNLMGALLLIGAGAQKSEWLGELMALKDRRLAPPTFMPDGLYLTKVDYDANWGLPKGIDRWPYGALGD